eukprot:CAMPEP_0115842474 /NCGR_PEP_ID=MMETSP0287-20121206/7819_1 /TAXON_ID=412157 /ORGANISM="Chrysochromulina rotalis, Strain UIO044" /LENGTH=186 /DNA_ID=CAMNT_0003296145 /DNA_START=327 /DNA_END=888 /DNA_ORIENTATION=+
MPRRILTERGRHDGFVTPLPHYPWRAEDTSLVVHAQGGHSGAEAALPLDKVLGSDHGAQVTVNTRRGSQCAIGDCQDLLHILSGGVLTGVTGVAARSVKVRCSEDVHSHACRDLRSIELRREGPPRALCQLRATVDVAHPQVQGRAAAMAGGKVHWGQTRSAAAAKAAIESPAFDGPSLRALLACV